MKATFIEKEDNKVKFTIDFSAEEFDKACAEAYRKTKSKYPVNGFRKGKAPRVVIESHYGEGVFFEDAINDMLQEAYPQAVEELEIEVIDSPSADFSEIGKNKPFTVTMEVPVYPIVSVKDYKNIPAEQVIYEIKDEDVDAEIEALQKRNSRMVPVERPVEDGDTVILDYAGFVGDEQFEGGTAENQQLKIGSGAFIPGFEDQLIGAEAGEKRDVEVTFPDQYAEELAGKDAIFHCTVHEIKTEELPELNDEFAKDVSEFDTLEELKADTKARLQENADARSKNEATDLVINEAYNRNEASAPESLIKSEVENMVNEINQNLMYQGMSIQNYLNFTGKTPEEFIEELRPEAEKRVVKRIILRSIAEAEGIVAEAEDVEAELEKLAEVYGKEKDEVMDMVGKENMAVFKRDVQMQKVMDMLYNEADISKITEAEMEQRIKDQQEKDKEAEADQAEEEEQKENGENPVSEEKAEEEA
jgi:trigger factor